ncbi:GNAT family N-acetyltransferase [Bacillus spongiae]|uniref:GNAT family N-acetyltransferase n=1 Tax=Bacillus spongiae TaxID=2683610 RepID=A0ABU8HGB7_9BACI
MNRFTHARNLVEERSDDTYPTFTYSVLEQIIAGQVYMDDSNRSVLIGTDSGIFVVAGARTNSAFHHIISEVYNTRIKENKRFTLFSPSNEWTNVIHNLFGDQLRQLDRYQFDFNADKFLTLNREELSNDYSIQKINQTLMTKSEEFNEPYFQEYWGSVANFMKSGVGFGLKYHDAIVSECVSIFASTQYAEIDIATQSKFRGRGLAQKIAGKFIEHCLEKKIHPRWDCDVSNGASIKLADRLGFENPTTYAVFVRK